MEMIKIYRARDNIEADLVKSLLESHNINAFIQGYSHRGMLGIVGSYIPLDIMVSEEQEEEARRIIQEGDFEEEIAEGEDSTITKKGDEIIVGPPPKLREKSLAVAFMLAFIIPGLGNYYAGRHNLGGWILTGLVICVITMFVFLDGFGIYFVIGYEILFLIDAISSILYLKENRKQTTDHT